MRRWCTLFLGGLLFWPTITLGQVDSSIVKTIASTELSAVHLPKSSPFCLAFFPVSNPSSEAAGDPSPALLSSLAGSGLRARKASNCYKALKGNVISVETLKREDNRFEAKVELTDVAVLKGEDLATLLRRGIYEFTKDASGRWKLQSYTSELKNAQKAEQAQH
jgi:hypothetical protein